MMRFSHRLIAVGGVTIVIAGLAMPVSSGAAAANWTTPGIGTCDQPNNVRAPRSRDRGGNPPPVGQKDGKEGAKSKMHHPRPAGR